MYMYIGSRYVFGYDNTIRNPTVFRPILIANLRYEKINFKTDAHLVPCRKKYKQNNTCYLQKSLAAMRYLAIKAVQ